MMVRLAWIGFAMDALRAIVIVLIATGVAILILRFILGSIQRRHIARMASYNAREALYLARRLSFDMVQYPSRSEVFAMFRAFDAVLTEVENDRDTLALNLADALKRIAELEAGAKAPAVARSRRRAS
jgi:hypothetical protein